MKVVDANVLLYAVNVDSPHHDEARTWLDEALSGADTVAFSWLAVLAFVRLVTKVGLFPNPLTVDEAWDIVDSWLGAGTAVVIDPSTGHSQTVRRLLSGIGTGGNLVNDAHLAALALEHGATVVSYDHDFARFAEVRRSSPRDLSG
jgi:toxin-antitoxin system PIN domain toxin